MMLQFYWYFWLNNKAHLKNELIESLEDQSIKNILRLVYKYRHSENGFLNFFKNLNSPTFYIFNWKKNSHK